MIDIRHIKLPETPKEIYDSEKDKFKVNSPEALTTKILSNKKLHSCIEDCNKFFKFRKGETLLSKKI